MKPLASRFLLILSLSGSCWAQVSPVDQLYRQSLAATCANCHGTNGKDLPNQSIPLISQLSSEELLAQLLAYKSGTRPGTLMPQLAKGYTDAQLESIANQLGKKP
ncbi:hypothetical protein G6652_07195 [Polynucleobacter paneuropaeus]|nr:hypothetical protein [Polynucleobacter paneuropaeus]MBT8617015.1 hypothetical protein [Polynucleobacter paneuropaeus]MBT8618895.1 hypothetical protein [Polynucleobacter paneuropaeus]MBT8620140.1 hypothetical protein [Polynucleobacter paneuropaeus]MBT8626312.1 hypothetical protein [Polynucleobacter paneuropaeus]